MVRVESKGKEEMEEVPLKDWDPTTPIENAWFGKIRTEDFKKPYQNTKAEETLVRTKRAKKKGKKRGGDGHKHREKEGDEVKMAGNILKGQ